MADGSTSQQIADMVLMHVANAAMKTAQQLGVSVMAAVFVGSPGLMIAEHVQTIAERDQLVTALREAADHMESKECGI